MSVWATRWPERTSYRNIPVANWQAFWGRPFRTLETTFLGAFSRLKPGQRILCVTWWSSSVGSLECDLMIVRDLIRPSADVRKASAGMVHTGISQRTDMRRVSPTFPRRARPPAVSRSVFSHQNIALEGVGQSVFSPCANNGSEKSVQFLGGVSDVSVPRTPAYRTTGCRIGSGFGLSTVRDGLVPRPRNTLPGEGNHSAELPDQLVRGRQFPSPLIQESYFSTCPGPGVSAGPGTL